MMVHRCGKDAEKNLTKIFNMVDSFMEDYNAVRASEQQLQGIFVAVSRNNMRQSWKDDKVMAMSENNWNILNERSSSPNQNLTQEIYPMVTLSNTPPVFECGELWVDSWYKTQDDIQGDYFGSILPSLINFYIATQAEVFVGVDKSSWSADVWATRYRLGKGRTNFKYTPNQGIVPLANNGRPTTHFSCKKMDEEASGTQKVT